MRDPFDCSVGDFLVVLDDQGRTRVWPAGEPVPDSWVFSTQDADDDMPADDECLEYALAMMAQHLTFSVVLRAARRS
jgi:uncharacterized protein YbdZ (MbtH family)